MIDTLRLVPSSTLPSRARASTSGLLTGAEPGSKRSRATAAALLVGVFLLGAFHLSAPVAAAAPPASPPPSSQAIKDLLAQDKVDEAIEGARRIIDADPKDAEGRVLMANALLRKARLSAGMMGPDRMAPISADDAAAVRRELETAIGLAPQRKDLYLGLVDVAIAAHDDNEMLKQIQRAEAEFPADLKMANALLQYGLERQSRNDPLARPIFESLYKAYPRLPETVVAWSSYLLNSGELDASTKVLEAGAMGTGSDISVLIALGDAYCYKLDFEGAAKQYSHASTIDPKRRAVRLRWATVLHLLDPRSALVVAEPLKSEKKAGRAPTLSMGKDGAIEGTGRVDRGVAALLRALQNPGMSGLELYELAKTYSAVGLPAESLVETQNAIVKDPLMVEPWVLRAQVYVKAGLDPQALVALDKALEIMGTGTGRKSAYTKDEILAAKAAALARLGRSDEALALYRSLTDASPYFFAMGLVEEKRGKFEEAQVLFEKVAASGTDPYEVEAAKAKIQHNSTRAKP